MKKLLSCMLALVLICTAFSVNANAAGTTISVKSDAKGDVKKNDTINYTVSLGAVTDIIAAEFGVVIPEGLTLVDGSAKVVEAYAKNCGEATVDVYGKELWFTSYMGDEYTTKGEAVLTFSCTVNEDVKAGDELTVVIKNQFIADVNEQEINATPSNSTIKVETPHEHSYTWEVTTQPSCEAAGVETGTCSCGHTTTRVYGEPLGHTSEDVEAKAPTCTEPGHTAGTRCTVCKKVLSGLEEIPATGHVDKDPVDGKCDVCGEEVAHDCKDADKDGKCDICGKDVKAEEEHKHVDANNDGKCDTCGKEIEASKTGDSANVALYAIMMAAAAAVVVYKKRRVEA